jgi:xanthosine utilization system XapX-like protein
MAVQQRLDHENYGIIDINSPASPAVLAGILGITVAMIYQYRQNGQLPANTNASYSECISHHVKYFKTRNNAKGSSAIELKVLADTKLANQKSEMMALEIAEKRKTLLNREIFLETLSPILSLINSSMNRIAKEYPETLKSITNLQATLCALGNSAATLAETDSANYVEHLLEDKVVMEDVEELLLPKDIDEELR